jgi:ParB/RepB/Spo0J family partition protein
MTIQIRELNINRIRVIDPNRPLDEKKLAAIKESMAKIGLKTPITVRARNKGPVLVAGLHRLKAAKALGWTEITCNIIDSSKIDAKLWGLAENLHRAELTAIQRAEFIEDWEKLLKKRDQDAQVAHPGGRQPHDKGNSATAKALGTSRDDVRRAKAIANISPKAKATAKAEGLGDNKSALLKVAKEKGEKAQVKKVRQLAQQKAKSGNGWGRTDQRHLDNLVEIFEGARRLKRAWESATPPARARFISGTLKPLGGN